MNDFWARLLIVGLFAVIFGLPIWLHKEAKDSRGKHPRLFDWLARFYFIVLIGFFIWACSGK